MRPRWLGGARYTGAQNPPQVMEGRAQRESRHTKLGGDLSMKILEAASLILFWIGLIMACIAIGLWLGRLIV